MKHELYKQVFDKRYLYSGDGLLDATVFVAMLHDFG
jgi:hypothetical protein